MNPAPPPDIVQRMSPRSPHRQARALSALLLLISALAAVAAFRIGESEEELRFYRAHALFRSEVLTDIIPLDALLLEIAGEEFRSRFEGEIEVIPQTGDPALFMASAVGADRDLSISSLTRLREAIESSLRRLATKEVRTLQETLKNVPKPVPETNSDSAPTPQPPEGPTEAERVQRQQAIRLSLEIDDLQAYLAGEAEPVWLSERIDEERYKKSKAAAVAAEAKLVSLRQTFKETSSQVVAQKKQLHQARETLKQNKQHLAKVLLKSYQQEFEELERQVARRIAQKVNSTPASTQQERALPSEHWTETLSGNLQNDEELLSARATVHQVNKTTVTEEFPHRRTLLLLWGLSSATLLLALLAWRSPEPDAAGLEQAALVSGESRSGSGLPPLRPVPKSEPDPSLLKLLKTLEQEQGEVNRFLILGSNERDTRSSVSARLAFTLSSLGREVRLVDLDVQQKTLSRKLGNSKTAGVIELVSGRGPAEEFLASISGTRIEFAPAGEGPPSPLLENSDRLRSLLKPRRPGGKLIIDAGFSSPLGRIEDHVEAVICVSAEQDRWASSEQELLFRLKELGLPIWGLFQSESRFHPF